MDMPDWLRVKLLASARKDNEAKMKALGSLAGVMQALGVR